MTRENHIAGLRLFQSLEKRSASNFRMLVLISLAHLPLGALIYFGGSLSLLHPFAVFVIGLYWAAKPKYRLERVALAIAYLVGAEVLWRMAKVPVFWEFGKYGPCVIAIVALIRRNHYTIPKIPLAYFLLLVPACVLTFLQTDFAEARDIISSQMSGALFLLIACWFFAHTEVNQPQLRRLLFALIIPLLSVAFATLFFTVTAEEIHFGGESNFATSGGFGPNQISSMLGMGTFVAVACLLIFQNSTKYGICLALAAIFFTSQSVLTFSRGGIYNAIGGILVIALIGLQQPSVTLRRLAPIAGLVLVFLAFVFPVMNQFTGGTLLERFEDTGTSQRTEIAGSDVQLFWENPVFGVGVGASYDLRLAYLDRKAMSHTEFSRMLSEHGIFGVLSLVMMATMIFMCFKRQRTLMGKAFVLGAAAWCCLFMTNAGMRMAAPSLMWGLMFITITNRRKNEKGERSRLPRRQGTANRTDGMYSWNKPRNKQGVDEK